MKSHKFDIVSFVPGILITAMGLIFLLPAELGDLIDAVADFDSLAPWFWATVFIVIGLLVLVPVLSRTTSRDRESGDATQSS